MPASTIAIPPHKRDRGRIMYEQTETPLQAIADYLGIGRTTLSQRIKEWNWQPRLHRVPPFHRAGAPPPAVAAELDTPAEMLRTVMRSVEQELVALDAIVARLKNRKDMGQAERVARTLSSLARTTREVMRLEAPPTLPAQPGGGDEDDPPYDLDSLRNDLLARLSGFVAAEQGCVPGDAPEPGAGDAGDDLGRVRALPPAPAARRG
jgi:hypothetical protein